MKHKKTNLLVLLLLLFAVLITTVVAKAFYDSHPALSFDMKTAASVTTIPEAEEGTEAAIQSAEEQPEIEQNIVEEVSPPDLATSTLSEEPSPPVSPVTEMPEDTGNIEDTSVTPASMENTLFIGDSRTVGLSEYAQMDGANFFATVGMSVYEIDAAKVSVPDVGKVTLAELLKNRQYDRIYVMLGINELGYSFEKTMTKYGDLINSVQVAQPDALIIIQANLHVTKARSDSDKVINNPTIDAFNDGIAQLADNERVFYLDANCIFDDADGALSEDKSGDNAHPLAKYYQEWGIWLANETGKILT